MATSQINYSNEHIVHLSTSHWCQYLFYNKEKNAYFGKKKYVYYIHLTALYLFHATALRYICTISLKEKCKFLGPRLNMKIFMPEAGISNFKQNEILVSGHLGIWHLVFDKSRYLNGIYLFSYSVLKKRHLRNRREVWCQKQVSHV